MAERPSALEVPQRKRAKKEALRAMLAGWRAQRIALAKAGGMHGSIVDLEDSNQQLTASSQQVPATST